MELRDIEIFLILAEELHFGRTAERLYVTPARVSQAVKKYERYIGAPLFDRTTRTVRLTEVGRQLRDDLDPVQTALRESVDRARMAARGATGRMRVLLMPFNHSALHTYWRAFRARNPQWELQVRLSNYTIDPFSRLRSGEFDALVVWLPVDEPDMTVGPKLFGDSRILAVSRDHRLASRSSAGLEDLGDFPVGTGENLPAYWMDAYLPQQTPRGRKIERALHAADGAEMITAVGMGDIVMPFPSHVTEIWSMPDIRWLPMPDVPTLEYVLVWRTEAENAVIRALAATISELGPSTR